MEKNILLVPWRLSSMAAVLLFACVAFWNLSNSYRISIARLPASHQFPADIGPLENWELTYFALSGLCLIAGSVLGLAGILSGFTRLRKGTT